LGRVLPGQQRFTTITGQHGGVQVVRGIDVVELARLEDRVEARCDLGARRDFDP
jgi:hypothetical protein